VEHERLDVDRLVPNSGMIAATFSSSRNRLSSKSSQTAAATTAFVDEKMW
jgi:hypothetical protein